MWARVLFLVAACEAYSFSPVPRVTRAVRSGAFMNDDPAEAQAFRWGRGRIAPAQGMGGTDPFGQAGTQPIPFSHAGDDWRHGTGRVGPVQGLGGTDPFGNPSQQGYKKTWVEADDEWRQGRGSMQGARTYGCGGTDPLA